MQLISRKVFSYCDIPEKLTQSSGLNEYSPDCYVNYYISNKDEISEHLKMKDPELQDGDIVFIEIDY